MPQSKIKLSRLVARVKAEELIRRGKPVITTSIEHFAKRGITQIGSTVRYEANPRVWAFINRWGATRITGDVNRTTIKRLRHVISLGVEAGKGYNEIAKDIGHVFDVAKGSRAKMIARTEVARASNFASTEGYRQAGVEQKEWQATIDDVTRESHDEMDGQIRDIDDDFDSPNGYSAPYPGEFGEASEDINCRCGVLPVVADKRLRGSRFWLFKGLERARVPYERRLRVAMAAGFEAQRKAVMEEFYDMVGEKAA